MSLISKYQRPTSVMDRFFNGMFNDPFFTTFETVNALSQPRVNIKENDTNFELELAAPGLHREDFTVDVHENNLTVKMERKVEEEATEEKYMRKEFSYTSFSRQFNLPKNVDVKAINAKYENGVLHIELPKMEVGENAPKLIDIK